jgi:hypothetical protein
MRLQDNTLVLALPPELEPLAQRLGKRKRGQEDGGPHLGFAGPVQPRLSRPARTKLITECASAYGTCAFKSGFAAEGMLCNEPPIPLRVLDFLGTYELVNLSLVCKATHQAGHVLLKREVRGSMQTQPAAQSLL